jgi:hypothetical protein
MLNRIYYMQCNVHLITLPMHTIASCSSTKLIYIIYTDMTHCSYTHDDSRQYQCGVSKPSVLASCWNAAAAAVVAAADVADV